MTRTYNMISTVIIVIKFEVNMAQKMLFNCLFSVAIDRSRFKGGSTFHKRGKRLK